MVYDICSTAIYRKHQPLSTIHVGKHASTKDPSWEWNDKRQMFRLQWRFHSALSQKVGYQGWLVLLKLILGGAYFEESFVCLNMYLSMSYIEMYVSNIYTSPSSYWLVVSTPLKNTSQNGNLPQIGWK